MRSVEEVISRVSAKATFLARFLSHHEREAFLKVYNEDFLKKMRDLLRNAYVYILPPLKEVEEKRKLVEDAMRHTPHFLAHHLPLLHTLLVRFSRLYSFQEMIRIHEERNGVNAREKAVHRYTGWVKTLIAAYHRFLSLSHALFKDIILTHADDFAKRVTSLDDFLTLLHSLTFVHLIPTNEAKHSFERHRYDTRFKTTAFEKLVNFFKHTGKIRMYHGVYDLGKSREYVRILLTKKGKVWKLLFIGTVHDHAAYEEILQSPAA